jgi:AraC family transcriptional regulator of adaptative response/methylated-DNA-[protein]-cysteine methyltransferase
MSTAISSAFELNFRTPNTSVVGNIKYAIGHCVEGSLLVARSRIDICAIFLGEDARELQEQLCDAFPSHSLEPADAELQRDLGYVAAFIDKRSDDGMPGLDIGGTPFQQRVWEALCDIPAGETRTYAEVAECIGAPEAVRAVASACAANLLAVAIPCHRVLRGDGSISGYRWGVERKRSLLARERA